MTARITVKYIFKKVAFFVARFRLYKIHFHKNPWLSRPSSFSLSHTQLLPLWSYFLDHESLLVAVQSKLPRLFLIKLFCFHSLIGALRRREVSESIVQNQSIFLLILTKEEICNNRREGRTKCLMLQLFIKYLSMKPTMTTRTRTSKDFTIFEMEGRWPLHKCFFICHHDKQNCYFKQIYISQIYFQQNGPSLNKTNEKQMAE